MVDTNLLSILNHSRRSRGTNPVHPDNDSSEILRPSSHLTAGTSHNMTILNESSNFDAEMKRHERLRDLIATYRNKLGTLRA